MRRLSQLFRRKSKQAGGSDGDGGAGAGLLARSESGDGDNKILSRARSLSREAGVSGQEQQQQQHLRKNSRELLQDLPEDMFGPDFNAVKFVLDSLPSEELTEEDMPWFHDVESDKDVARDVVVARLYRAVMNNYEAFVKGLQRIREIEMDLTTMAVLVKNTRRVLASHKDEFVRSVLATTMRVQKRKRLMEVLQLVRDAQALRKAEGRLRAHVDGESDDDVDAALDAQREVLEMMARMRGLACFANARGRVMGVHSKLMGALATRLTACALSFDAAAVDAVVRGHVLMCQLGGLPRFIQEVFAEAVEHAVEQEMRRHVPGENAQKMRLADLCKAVDSTAFPGCFARVGTLCVRILYNYTRVQERAATASAALPQPSDEVLALVDALRRDYEAKKSVLRDVLLNAPTTAAQPIRALPPAEQKAANSKKKKQQQQGKGEEGDGEEEQGLEEKTRKDTPEAVAARIEKSRKGVWRAVQDVVSLFLSSVTLTPRTIQLEDFLRTLETTSSLKQIGERFSSSPSYGLISSVQGKSKEYIDTFHRQNIYYMRQTLENELWRVLPLPPTFGIGDIKELNLVSERGGRAMTGASGQLVPPDVLYDEFLEGRVTFEEEEEQEEEAEDGAAAAAADAERKKSAEPWRPSSLRRKKSELDEEEAKKREEEGGGEEEAPKLLTSTSLNMARFIGRYVHIMQMLPPLALQAFHALTELFDFYLYNVFNLFGVNAHRFYQDSFPEHLYPRLRAAMIAMRARHLQHRFGADDTAFTPKHNPRQLQQRQVKLDPSVSSNVPTFIKVKWEQQQRQQQLLLRQHAAAGGGDDGKGDKHNNHQQQQQQQEQEEEKKKKKKRAEEESTMASRFSFLTKSKSSRDSITAPHETPEGVVSLSKVDIYSPSTVYGLIERASAVESLRFLLEILDQVENKMAIYVPKEEQPQIVEFMAYAHGVVDQMLVYMYRNFPSLVLPIDQVLSGVASCKWHIRELSSKHNDYVNTIVQGFMKARQTIESLGGLPRHVMDRIWAACNEYLMEQLLQAYAKVKKWTPEGRAAVNLDLSELKNTLLTMQGRDGSESVPKWQLVVDWVKAFYLPSDADLLLWVREHAKLYTVEQCVSLASTGLGAAMKKKQRLELIEAVEDAHRAGLEQQ